MFDSELKVWRVLHVFYVMDKVWIVFLSHYYIGFNRFFYGFTHVYILQYPFYKAFLNHPSKDILMLLRFLFRHKKSFFSFLLKFFDGKMWGDGILVSEGLSLKIGLEIKFSSCSQVSFFLKTPLP